MEGDKGRGILSTNEWLRTAPDGALEALYMAALCVCRRTVFGTTAAEGKRVVRLPRGFANFAAHISSWD
jgi:hypothetical protein